MCTKSMGCTKTASISERSAKFGVTSANPNQAADKLIDKPDRDFIQDLEKNLINNNLSTEYFYFEAVFIRSSLSTLSAKIFSLGTDMARHEGLRFLLSWTINKPEALVKFTLWWALTWTDPA